MTDPLMMSVASAMAGKAADAVADGVKSAWDALAHMVRSRISDSSHAETALRAAQAQPEDSARVRELAAALEQLALSDPQFRAQLADLWPRASAELSARGHGVVNSSTGTVGGHLIQAGELHVEGGLHLGDSPGPQPS